MAVNKARVLSEDELSNIKGCFYTTEGKLYWAKDMTSKIKKGDLAGYDKGNGYRRVGLYGRHYLEHRVIYYLHYGEWPDQSEVDHINGIRDDNRPDNLRLVCCKGNQRGFKTKVEGASSKYRGVSYSHNRKRWESRIWTPKGNAFLGRFTCEKEAALAYNYKAMEIGFSPEAFNKVFEDV